MTTKTIDISTVQADLLQLIEEVRAGTDIVLSNEHGPFARLVPIVQKSTPPQRMQNSIVGP